MAQHCNYATLLAGRLVDRGDNSEFDTRFFFLIYENITIFHCASPCAWCGTSTKRAVKKYTPSLFIDLD